MKAPLIIKTVLLTIIAVLVWYGLVLQLYLIIQAAREKGTPLFGEVVRYFSYFTILTNLFVAVCVTSILLSPRSRPGRFFSGPAVQSGIAIYILVVGVTYSVALRHIWNPVGLQYAADRVLHDTIPVLYILYWAFFVPKNTLKWSDPLRWLVYPFVYLVYVILRGQFINEYPYYFLDPTLFEWSRVWMSIAVLFAGFAGLGYLMVGISRLFYQQPRSL
jgi:hypothetical protein